MINRYRSTCARALSGAALLAIAAIPAQAFAQDTAPAEDEGGLAEIVVTAQHRSENLKDVPISINAISGDALKSGGVSDTTTLVQAVPSLNFTRSGPAGIFVIRGVATPNGSAGEEGSTAVYVDDVYMPDLAQTVNTFNNIERVEVLNGPQGTLFGRNATGGLIRIITREPGDRLEFKGQFGASNYDTFNGQAYLSAPLTENVAMDLAFTGQEQGQGFGFDKTINRRVRTDDYWGLRSKLVARPNDNLKITVAGEYFHTNNNIALYLFPIIIDPATGIATGPTAGQDSEAAYPSGTRIRVWGVSAKAELELGIGTLTSITGYRKLTNSSSFDIDGRAPDLFHLSYNNSSKSFQQELRLASATTEPLSWQIGAFYLHAVSQQDQTQAGLALALPAPAPAGSFIASHIVAKGVTDSISIFGEATYAITPTTHITGGVRWTSDHRKLPIGYVDTILLSNNAILAHRTNPLSTKTFTNVTYRAAIRQDLTDSVNVYASVNKGFKSGNFYLQQPYDAPVRPQTIMAYEAGLKGDFFDRHLRLSIAGYHYDIKDYQVRTTAGTVTTLLNAAKVKIDGVDFNAEAALGSRLRLTAGAAYINARYVDFGSPGSGFIAPGFYPAGRAYFNPVTGARIGGDASGNQTALAPHFTLNLGGNYTIPFDNGSELRLTAAYTHKSSYVFEPDNVLRQPAYDVVNAAIEYQVNDNFAVEMWMRNIGDEQYNVQMVTSVGQAAIAGAPRQYGINAKFNF